MFGSTHLAFDICVSRCPSYCKKPLHPYQLLVLYVYSGTEFVPLVLYVITTVINFIVERHGSCILRVPWDSVIHSRIYVQCMCKYMETLAVAGL